VIRVILPTHLWRLANVEREVILDVPEPLTIRSVLETLEQKYPMLQGTIRDHATKERRAYIRFFACGEDFSHEPQDIPLPAQVIDGSEPFRVVGAMSGG
jgi:hypothetical protein